MTRARRRCRATSAFSYLELCLAMLILALCIVPAARALPGVLAGQRDLETKYQLCLLAQEKLESAVLDLERAFLAGHTHGTLASEGRSDWHYDVLVEVPVVGLGRYATVRARAWVDLDGGADVVPDPGDPQVRFDTLVANRQWSP